MKNEKTGDTYFIKKHSSSLEDTKVWIKLVSKNIAYLNDNGIKEYANGSELSLYDINCVERKMKTLQFIIYNFNDIILENTIVDDKHRSWVEVVPETISEIIIIKACQILKK